MIIGTAGVAGIMTGLQSGQSGRKGVLADHSSVIRVEVTNGCGPGSAVGVATGYGLDGPGIESRWGRDFPHLSRPALGPT